MKKETIRSTIDNKEIESEMEKVSKQELLKIAICDDDTKDVEAVTSIIHKYLDTHLQVAKIDVFSSGEEFLKQDSSDYLLVFMDIYMKELTGMETARQIYKNNQKTKIIFCSSSSEFGVESYDVDALGYILKPIDEKKIFTVLDRFFYIYTSLKSIVVKVNRMDERIYLNDIIWVESNRNQCIIHTKKQDYVTRSSFSVLCEQFSNTDFAKPIRYALVSLKEVVNVPTDVFVLSNGDEIPIAKDNREKMRDAYMNYLWKHSFSGKRGM